LGCFFGADVGAVRAPALEPPLEPEPLEVDPAELDPFDLPEALEGALVLALAVLAAGGEGSGTKGSRVGPWL